MGDRPRWVRRLLDLVILFLAIKKLDEWFGGRDKSSDNAGPTVPVDVGVAKASIDTHEWSRVLQWPWVRENIVWLIGVTPLALACYRIFYVSGGDPISLRVLVTNLDVVQIAIVTILSLLPVGLFYAGLVIIERVLFDVPGENLPAWSLGLGIASTFVGFILMNRFAANWVAIGLGILVILALVLSYFVRKIGAPRLVLFGGALVVFSVLQALTASSDHWLPAENIDMESGGARTGFVIEEKEKDMTIQWHRGPVEVVEGSQVVSREFCTFEKDRDKYLYKLWPDRLWNELCIGSDYQAPKIG